MPLTVQIGFSAATSAGRGPTIVIASAERRASRDVRFVPILRGRLNEKFARGTENQSLLVETITGIQTVKANALEPQMARRWDNQLAAYVSASFKTQTLATWAHEGINLIGKLINAATLWFGAEATAVKQHDDHVELTVRQGGETLTLLFEPGRSIAANAGLMLTRVEFLKPGETKNFAIVDAAMNDLIRPTLYDSFHRIWPAEPSTQFPNLPEDYEAEIPGTMKVDVVGPVCESGDFLAKGRCLPPLNRGDLLATFSAGAYGMAMSSNYNSRLRAAEVLVDGNHSTLIRRRETYQDLVGPELDAMSSAS